MSALIVVEIVVLDQATYGIVKGAMETLSFFTQLERDFSDLLNRGGDIRSVYQAIDIQGDAAQHVKALHDELSKEKTGAGTLPPDELHRLAKLAALKVRLATRLKSLPHTLEFNELESASLWDYGGQWIFGPCQHAHLSDFRSLAARATTAADLLHIDTYADEALMAWLALLKSEGSHYHNDEIAGIVAASIAMCRKLATAGYRTEAESPDEIAPAPESADAPASDVAEDTRK